MLRLRQHQHTSTAAVLAAAVWTAATAAFVLASGPVRAQQEWPTRPVTFINPFTAGSAVDVVARLVSQQMSKNLNHQFVIENRTGASGNIGTELAARARPDGTSFLVGSPGTMAINPWLFAKLPYDAVKDFTAVTQLVSFPQVLAVNPALPIKTFGDLIAFAKSRPGKVNYGSSGQGSTSHLVMELIKAEGKLAMEHVPYRGGTPAIAALIAGDVQVAVEGLPSLPGHIRSGAIRAIGVTTPTRAALIPDVPALAESIPGFDASAWIIMFAPTGTAASIVERMAVESRRALEDPGVRAKLAEMGATPIGSMPAETAALHRRELEKFKRAVAISGAKAEQ